MDYIDHVEIKRHDSWNKFKDWAAEHGHRLVLVETDGAASYTDFNYTEKDILILGRESAGTPREVYGEVAATIFIPMREKMRSLNVAMAGAIVVGEMARQLNVSKTK
jgi:tRNA (cytidine/uridine-2'-O-)-methyltransferase